MRPIDGIVLDVKANLTQFSIIADHMIKEIALPNRFAQLSANFGFQSSDDDSK